MQPDGSLPNRNESGQGRNQRAFPLAIGGLKDGGFSLVEGEIETGKLSFGIEADNRPPARSMINPRISRIRDDGPL